MLTCKFSPQQLWELSCTEHRPAKAYVTYVDATPLWYLCMAATLTLHRAAHADWLDEGSHSGFDSRVIHSSYPLRLHSWDCDVHRCEPRSESSDKCACGCTGRTGFWFNGFDRVRSFRSWLDVVFASRLLWLHMGRGLASSRAVASKAVLAPVSCHLLIHRLCTPCKTAKTSILMD